MIHTTESGYVARETLSGIDIEDSNGKFICELSGVSLNSFMDEDDNIDEEKLDEAISSEMEVQTFLEDQADYM